MPDIHHHLLVKAERSKLFAAASTAKGLDAWWTKSASGEPAEGAEYTLGFGPEHQWQAVVSRYAPDEAFELRLTRAHPDWQDTRVGVELAAHEGITELRFHHSGWPKDNDHYRISCYCWAMYLRLLKRHVELGEFVPYEQRLDV